MALPVPISAGRLPALNSVGMLAAQVIGVSDVAGALLSFGKVLARRALHSDAEYAQEMVDRMRADAPYDEGTLYNGITWRREGNEFVVEASAVDPRKGGADYAGFVERGTRAGVRGGRTSYVADSAYFDLNVEISDGTARTAPAGRRYARSRRVYRTHPGTPAQPYFFHNARDVYRKRARAHRVTLALTAAEVGLAGYQLVGSGRDIARLAGYGSAPLQIGHG